MTKIIQLTKMQWAFYAPTSVNIKMLSYTLTTPFSFHLTLLMSNSIKPSLLYRWNNNSKPWIYMMNFYKNINLMPQSFYSRLSVWKRWENLMNQSNFMILPFSLNQMQLIFIIIRLMSKYFRERSIRPWKITSVLPQ